MTRASAVVAMDTACEPAVARLSERAWNHVRFVNASAADLLQQIGTADLVVMVATAGADAPAAAAIGRSCSERRATTTALVVGGSSAPDEALSHTLAQLRPWSLMIVVARDDDYIEGVLTALRV